MTFSGASRDPNQAAFAPAWAYRTRCESMRQKIRALWLGVIVIISALGIAGIAENEARGDMVLSLDALPGVLAQGAAGTVSQGGNGVYLRIDRNNGTTEFNSGFAFNYGGRGHAYVAGHSVFNNLSFNPTFSIGTGPNFNTNPGSIFTADSYRLAPGYAGPGTIGSALDVAYLSFATEIPGAGTISFPTGTLNTSGNVNLVSFGSLVVRDVQNFGQTGDAYGGVAAISGLPPLFGGNPELYQRVNMSIFDPAGTRATNGSSGGLVYQDILGTRYALGIATQAQTTLGGGGYQYARFDSAAFQAFHAANMSAVPEPSSLVLLGAFVVAGGACRLKRKCRTHQRELRSGVELC
jgi:hypothetical protein